MYDPMVAKLIVWDVDREQATARMLRALNEYEIEHLKTLIPFHKAILKTKQWADAETCRDLIEDRDWLKELAFPSAAPAESEADEEAKVQQSYTVEVSGKRFDVTVIGPPPVAGAAVNGARKPPRRSERAAGGGAGGGDTLATAVACALAHGYTVPDAVGFGKQWVTESLRAAYPLGHGHGPVSPLFRLS